MKKDYNDLALFDEGDLGLSILNDLFGVPKFRRDEREMNHLLKTDIKENEDSYALEVEMPGVNKQDINLELKKGYLTISAEKHSSNDEKDKKGNYVRRERFYGSKSRSFYVGNNVKEEDIKASLDNGVLNIEIPKAKPQIEQTKKIEIK